MSSVPTGATTVASHSTAAVARRLGVSIPTVQRWVDLGHLKAWKTVGGHRRIDAASVERFIQSREPHEDQPGAAVLAAAGLSVLIVDDNPDDRDVLSALAEVALPGVIVQVAENGFEALMAIGRKRPDILITDIVMPHMNGFEMLRHIATQSAPPPRVVFAVSSRTAEQFAELGALPPDVKFLPKPIDPERFVAALQAAVGASGPISA